MYLDAALADDWDDEVEQPAPVEAGAPRKTRGRLRRPVLLATGTALLAAALLAFSYQPLGPGTVSAADQRLLIPVADSPASHIQTAEFRYRFQAATSYETLVYVRNDGPLPVTLAGIDAQTATGPAPIVRPVELRLLPPGSRAPFGDWNETQPFQESVIASGQQLALWVRWQTSACPPNNVLLAENGSTTIGSIPLRWSVAGIPRRSALDLGYTVRFIVTPQTFSGQCQPAKGVTPLSP